MWVKKFTGNNFCQYKKVTVDFAPGLNVIVGPNGSGKSNIMKGVFAALTGDFSRNEGVKADNISQFSGPRDESGIEVAFEHNGTDFTIERGLRPSRHRLSGKGMTDMTRDVQIAAAIGSNLGVTPDILAEYVFVDQWCMFDFLLETEAQRAQSFQRLFGLDKFERINKEIGSFVKSLPQPTGFNPVADSDSIQLEQIRTRMAEITSTLSQRYANVPDVFPENDPDQIALWNHANAWSAATRYEEVTKQHQYWSDSRSSSLMLELDMFKTVAALECEATSMEEKVQAARAALVNIEAHTRMVAAQQKAERDTAAAQSALGRHLAVTPQRPPNGIPASPEVNERIAFLRATIMTRENFFKTFRDGVYHCPTCFTPTSNLESMVGQFRVELPNMKAELENITNGRVAQDHYDHAIRKFEQETLRLQAALQACQQVAAASRPMTTEVPVSIKDVRDIITNSDVRAEALKKNHALLNQYRMDAETSKVRMETLAAELQSLESRRVGVLDAERYKEISDRLALKKCSVQDKASLIGEYRALQASEADAIRRLEEHRRHDTENRVRQTVIEGFETIRSLSHWDSLPRLVSQSHLQELCVETNNFLDRFSSPFRVSVGDDLSFRATYLDGREMPVGRLSGAEKMVLALSFRVAVNSHFASDVGMLWLDEPTVGMDSQNLTFLQNALTGLKSLSESKRLQIVVITHDQTLARMFDHRIDVGALNV